MVKKYRILVEQSEGKRPLGWPRCRGENNIKIDFKEVSFDARNWMELTAKDGNQWWTYIRMVMNLRVH